MDKLAHRKLNLKINLGKFDKFLFSGKEYAKVITSCTKLGRRGWSVALEVLNSFRANPTILQAIAECISITGECNSPSEAAEKVTRICVKGDSNPAATNIKAGALQLEDELAQRYRSVPSRAALEALAICYSATIGVCRASGAGSWRAAVGLLDQMREDGLSQRMLAAFPHVRKGFGTNMYRAVIDICASAGEWRQVSESISNAMPIFGLQELRQARSIR